MTIDISPRLPNGIKGVHVSIEKITPEMAQEILDEHNPNNRRLSPVLARTLAGYMDSGEFSFTGEPILFDDHGNLVDAQHRLQAVIIAGKPQWFVVVRGVPHKAIEYIDRGRNRNLGDTLVIRGYVPRSLQIPAAQLVKSVYKYNEGARGTNLYVGQGSKPHPTDAFYGDFYAEHSEAINWAIHKAKEFPRAVLDPKVARLICYTLPQVDKEMAEEFIDGLINGTKPEDGVIHRLRERLIEEGRNRRERLKYEPRALFLIYRGWNAIRRGEDLQRFLIPTDITPGDIPEPV